MYQAIKYGKWNSAESETRSFYYVVLIHIVAWVYGWVIQEKYTVNPPSLDWSDPGFTEGFFVILLWGACSTIRRPRPGPVDPH